MQEAMRSRGLHTQILAVNSVLMVAAILATAVTARSGIDGGVDRRQWLVLGAALLTTVLVNALVLARRLKPLGELLATMERVDLSSPGLRASALREDSADAVRLKDAFNRMLARLEQERASAGRAILRAQEDERARVARDLHDECNQALTAVLLRLGASVQHAPPELVAELRETQVVAGRAMDELLRLATSCGRRRSTTSASRRPCTAWSSASPCATARAGPCRWPAAWTAWRPTPRSWSTAWSRRPCRTSRATPGARGVHVDVLARGARPRSG
jgi:hypothetical protein